ncbi:MAG: SDR family oxidoreductase [Bacteroidales bacterium]|nr:SDR family oxidoreductase [Bacteroidales bacterium]MCD8394966.1 SDR family oxidoreductase [Bacteroidales bacterium]
MIDYNPFSLQGKTVLVTGASSGIGRATAIECSRLGANLVITGRDQNRLEETLKAMDGDGHSLVVADLSQSESVDALLSATDVLDGVVHCAGINQLAPINFATPDKIRSVMDVNFFAPYELTRMLNKKKRLAKGASVVFISSVSGVYVSAPASSIYSATKGALNGAVKGMALDLAPKGIRVNSVTPGVIETNIFDAGTVSAEQLEENKKQYPLGRFGQPREVALGVAYLLSDASQWVTGSNLKIDGGLTLL